MDVVREGSATLATDATTFFNPRQTLQRDLSVLAVQEHAARSGRADLSLLDATELNRRCGVCHRSPDEIPEQDLTPENDLLIRFAPVGMSMSRCFTESDGLKCTLCHDPHRRETRSNGQFARVCHNCHQPDEADHTLCTKVDASSQGCLNCHMPKVEVQKSLHFTDHWIRVRE